ncbi:MAG: hypothetical protein IRY99_21265 [Isosphaeraceae bacterium]|nr:hypothetical protein [Isosphaeraceae bacterium]
MPRPRFRSGWLGLLTLAGGLLSATAAGASGPPGPPRPLPSPQGGPAGPIPSLDQLLRKSPAELEALYRQAGLGPIPAGPARGQALLAPGTRLGALRSKAARLVWQGKVFHPEDATAINRFFGLRLIRAHVSYGESWLDGRPAIILDYRETSRLYARYRDEIRPIAPGLYLGLMYDRTTPQPTLKLLFALDTRS